LTFSPAPTLEADIEVFVDGKEQNSNTYAYATSTVTFNVAPADGATVLVKQITAQDKLGIYQYVSIDDLANNFRVAYVGEGKIISKIKIPDINFHIQRAIQEFSYDTLKSEKSQEVELPPSLKIKLPHDYVNYVQFSIKDNDGIEKILYPARKTSNPNALLQDSDQNYIFDGDGSLLKAADSDTWQDFKASQTTNEDLT